MSQQTRVADISTSDGACHLHQPITMATEVMPPSRRGVLDRPSVHTSAHPSTAYWAPLGRLLFSLVFLLAAPGHFTAQSIAYAASQGVPMANVLVPFTGLLLILGGLSVLFGFHARVGAILLALFLVPVTLVMHPFWALDDAGAAQVQQIMFMKNLALLGGALLILHFGAGPISLDERRESKP
jgi:putative oxidoreductase